MSRRIFELDRKGVREILKSDEVETALKAVAEEFRSRLGEGYGVDTKKGKKRANAAIYPESGRARHDNYVNNSILKAVFGK